MSRISVYVRIRPTLNGESNEDSLMERMKTDHDENLIKYNYE